MTEFAHVKLGDLDENITTIGIDLKKLGKETKLHFVDQEHGVNGNGNGNANGNGKGVVILALYLWLRDCAIHVHRLTSFAPGYEKDSSCETKKERWWVV